MKHLFCFGTLLLMISYAFLGAAIITGCSDDQPHVTLVKDARFTVTCLPTVSTSSGCPDVTPIMVRDVKTGTEYLVLCTTHDGITMMKLDPVPSSPSSAEKAP